VILQCKIYKIAEIFYDSFWTSGMRLFEVKAEALVLAYLAYRVKNEVS